MSDSTQGDSGNKSDFRCQTHNRGAVAVRWESKNPGWKPPMEEDNYDVIHVYDGGSKHLHLATEGEDWVVTKLADPIGRYDITLKRYAIQVKNGDALEYTGNVYEGTLYLNGKKIATNN